MTRDELEAVIWRTVTYQADEGTGGYLLTPAQVDTILAAADAYALNEYGITADRRAQLAAAIAPTRRRVHFLLIDDDGLLACVRTQPGKKTRSTANPHGVECLNCKRTRAWKAAA